MKNSVVGCRRSRKPKSVAPNPGPLVALGGAAQRSSGRFSLQCPGLFWPSSPRSRGRDTGPLKVSHRSVLALCFTCHMPLQFRSVFPSYRLSLFAFSLSILQEAGHDLPFSSLRFFSFSPKDSTNVQKQMFLNVSPCELALSEVFLSFCTGRRNVGGGSLFPFHFAISGGNCYKPPLHSSNVLFSQLKMSLATDPSSACKICCQFTQKILELENLE